MIKPFALLLSLETDSGESKLSSTFFYQIEVTLLLKSKELRLSFTSMWVLQKDEVFRNEASTWESVLEEETVQKVYQWSKWEGSLLSPTSSLFKQTQIQIQTTSPNHLLEDLEDHHLDPLLMMKMKVRNLHQGHLHQDHLHQNHLHQNHLHQDHLHQDHPHQHHLHQGHPHQRSNLRRVQMKTHHPSNLRVIDRYDSSSLSIRVIWESLTGMIPAHSPNPTGLTL